MVKVFFAPIRIEILTLAKVYLSGFDYIISYKE